MKHDGWDYHLHATSSATPLATRMAVEAAMAVFDLVRGKELARLRTCEYAVEAYRARAKQKRR